MGVTRSCSLYPRSVQAFCCYVKLLCPQLSFSSLSVLLNVRSLPHRDGNNLETEPNLVAPLSDFRNGEIWVETSEGKIPLTVKGKILHDELLGAERPVPVGPSQSPRYDGVAGATLHSRSLLLAEP